MYSSKFPFSMENLPRQKKTFGCFSLKFGSVLTGILLILYSIIALAQCAASLSELPAYVRELNDFESVLTFAIVIAITVAHAVTLFLSTIMVVGVLREKHHLIKPWLIWMSIQLSVAILVFVMWSTMSFINSTGGSLLVYMLQFVGILIRFYMLMLVASFFKDIEEEKDDYERLKNITNSSAWYSAV